MQLEVIYQCSCGKFEAAGSTVRMMNSGSRRPGSEALAREICHVLVPRTLACGLVPKIQSKNEFKLHQEKTSFL